MAGKAYNAGWILHYLDSSENLEAVTERTINKIKQHRTIAARYDKTVISFLGNVLLCHHFR